MNASSRIVKTDTSSQSRVTGKQLYCLAAFAFIFAGLQDTAAQAQSCGNSIVCENALAGNTGWDPGAGDASIQGFATDISVNLGQTAFFKVKTNAASYHLDIYRLGYYGGAGARKIAVVNPSAALPQNQPACLTDVATRLIDCGNWAVSASWQVPSTLTSGIYFGNLVRTDTGGVSQLFFIVRNDASKSDILFQTSDETWVAYNDYGGQSLYGGAGTFDLNSRAFKVSYNRPFDTRNFEAATFLFSAEYPMVRWLEANGYDVSYFSGIDAARHGNLIANHQVYLSVGHDEYVSGPRRASIEAARDSGVNLAFFSGNELFWKTRLENSIDGSNTANRTVVCYKETYYGSGILYQQDPNDPPTWTGTWADPTFSPPADGGRPQNALTGTQFAINGPGTDNTNLSIQIPAADGRMRFWRNTSIATLGNGQIASLPGGTLGYEWDIDLDNGSRPPGLVPLSTSTYTLTADLLLDYGAIYGAGTATHHMSLHRTPSGSLVFGAGTVQWAWGLDSNHDGSPVATDVRMQQATVNLFADMGPLPATLQPGLVTASKTSDTSPPSTTIISPAPGATVPFGSPLTITGTATDFGGGVVGVVEISVNGGQTWHAAAGREQWSYSWTPYSSSGLAAVMVRAADDSGNLQASPTTAFFSIAGSPACPCSIWNPSTLPGTLSANDPGPVELGLRFRSDVSGFVSAVRFYKGATNTGTHTGNLWTAGRAKLAGVTFVNETQSGWQQANFSSPVLISANTTYIVSYYAPNGGYSVDSPFFVSSGVDKPPLHALQNGVDGRNGSFLYASGGGFPSNTFNESNYWVDLVFTLAATISGTVSGGSGATVTLSGAASASAIADASGNYNFPGLANGSYTVTPSKTGATFIPASTTVTVNGTSVAGVNFTVTGVPTFTISGGITGGGGEITVALSGAAASTVIADASGNYSFPNLVNGSYSVTPGKSGFTFAPASVSVIVNGANTVGVNFTANSLPAWSISGHITGASAVTISLSGASNASQTSDASGNYSFTGLLNGAYTVAGSKTGFAISPASQPVNVNGANVSAVSFTAVQFPSIWNNSTIPGTPASSDASAVELGMKFRSDVPGSILGVRFYKGITNTGTHIGNLWTTAGAKLASVTFIGEGSSGWQQASFSTPVAIAPNTTYIISYLAPNGHYAADQNFFAGSGVNSPPLHALANGVDGGNGVYVYGSAGGFPASTFASTNYWVDVVFATGTTWSISGAISGGGGATVTLSGAAAATVTADATGNFSFPGLINGSYTVTPTKTGFTFTPASAPVTVNGANVTAINFTGTGTTWSISGAITGGSGATVTLSGAAAATVTADATGNFSFPGLINGSYMVTPTKTGSTFTPASAPVTVNGANVTAINFTGTGTTWSISGTITGGSGATVTLSGAAAATVTADATGNFSFPGLINGSYTVTPTKTGFTFTPASAPVTVNGANVGGVNFAAKVAITIDVTTSVDQPTAALAITTFNFSTTAGNELLLAFVTADYVTGKNTAVSGIAGAGLTWVLAVRTNTQMGTAEIWRAFATLPLNGAVVTATLSNSVVSSLTIMSFKGVDPSGINGSGAIGATISKSAGSGAPTASLVTTRNNSWVFGVGNDYDNAIDHTPGAGQSLVHQYLTPTGDTYWVQMQNGVTSASGTTVNINDTAPTIDRYNLSVCEIVPAP